jgi:hypothetical protein
MNVNIFSHAQFAIVIVCENTYNENTTLPISKPSQLNSILDHRNGPEYDLIAERPHHGRGVAFLAQP